MFIALVHPHRRVGLRHRLAYLPGARLAGLALAAHSVNGVYLAGEAAAFVRVDRWDNLGSSLSARSIARIVADRAATAGLGGALGEALDTPWVRHTTYASGTPEVALMRHGRWRSATAMRGYLDEGTVWSDDPTRRLGL